MQQPAPQLINTFRCHQNWNSMSATANGRHCSGCKKEVHDFTGMEPAQILQVLQQHSGPVCGRVEAHKVQFRPELHPRNRQLLPRIGHWYRVAAAAVSAFLVLVVGKAYGQEATQPKGAVDNFGTFTPTLTHKTETKPAAEDTVGQKVSGYILKGTVTDAETGETIPFANVVLKQKGKQIAGASADFDGIYKIEIESARLNGLPVDVEVSYVGYNKKLITGVTLLADLPRVINVKLSGNELTLVGELIITYTEPILSDHDAGTKTLTSEEIRKSPSRNINEMLQTQPGVLGR